MVEVVSDMNVGTLNRPLILVISDELQKGKGDEPKVSILQHVFFRQTPTILAKSPWDTFKKL